jgi:hypothetical protein
MAERGAPFTAAGFGNWFRKQCNLAGLRQCSAHGLRKLMVTRLAEAGCSTEQIKAITGHRSASEVARYTRAADQRRLARQAMSLLRAEREQDLPSCAHDDDRLRFPPTSPAHNGKTGKKESTGRRLNRPCRPCATPSSNSSLGYHRNDVRTAENGFATSSGVSQFAKVVLVNAIDIDTASTKPTGLRSASS